jgi:hypothetical protein
VGSAVTLLWIELADGEREVLEQAVRDAGATMRRADREGLAAPQGARGDATRTRDAPGFVGRRRDVVATGAARTAFPQVAPALTALVHQAAEALGEVSGPRAAIQVRLAEHEDTVVLEVQHAAGGAPGDLRPSLVETFLASSATPRTRLVDLRERVRRCGGDLVVDGDHTSTTVRVFFPALASELFHEGPADHALPRTR